MDDHWLEINKNNEMVFEYKDNNFATKMLATYQPQNAAIAIDTAKLMEQMPITQNICEALQMTVKNLGEFANQMEEKNLTLESDLLNMKSNLEQLQSQMSEGPGLSSEAFKEANSKLEDSLRLILNKEVEVLIEEEISLPLYAPTTALQGVVVELNL